VSSPGVLCWFRCVNSRCASCSRFPGPNVLQVGFHRILHVGFNSCLFLLFRGICVDILIAFCDLRRIAGGRMDLEHDWARLEKTDRKQQRPGTTTTKGVLDMNVRGPCWCRPRYRCVPAPFGRLVTEGIGGVVEERE
jgi:hypothetical protein